ncbi:MAG: type II toxin-antitoxin system RatA family toxin [Rhodospirillales bacterium]|nr:type II toxin-antitoxin system RatA family toxin [Rhodospirillales bacterium]
MPTHAEKRHLPYTAQQMFELVADVGRYPEFLPWCLDARVIERQGPLLRADLVVGFKIFRETFTSEVTLTPPKTIQVRYLDGPFKRLDNRWTFEPNGQSGCSVDFYIDFEFHSRLFQGAMEAVFGEAAHRMVGAFEKRAEALYGKAA